jgi:hypothetical protein
MINYIVACYMGNRRQQNVDPLAYVKNHIKWLEITKEIDNAIFVFNDASYIKHNRQEEAVELVIEAGHDYIIRDNINFSYGAWEEGIKSIIKEDKYNYSFLIEDDYIPSQEILIDPFIKRFKYGELNNIEIGFVACFYDTLISDPNHTPSHAAISNGLISHTAIRDTISQNLEIFRLFRRNENPSIASNQTKTDLDRERDLHAQKIESKIARATKSAYGGAVWNQKHFLRNIEELGYRSTDITKENHTLFYATVGSGVGMHTYGNKDGICLMEPNFYFLNTPNYEDKSYLVKRHNKRYNKR